MSMWAWSKRIVLFLALNFVIVMTISLIMRVFGVQPYITAYGINYQSLLIFCFIWGMGGALISLALSRVMAKWMMGVQVIDPQTRDSYLQDVVQMVHQLCRSAGITKMPQVGIYDSPEVNAFATGPTKNRSLVAISTGLLNRMSRDQVEGVLGHEVTHISNGDMVAMTLIQGVVNAFVMFAARAIAFAIAQSGRSDDRDRGFSPMMYWVLTMVLEIVFMILGSIVVASFSRWREYRADKGGARLAGREKMISALQALQRTYEYVDPNTQPAVATLKISSRPMGIWKLFSSHPPLSDRIARLEAGA
jgi:heat shock protein HtpX